MHCTNGRGCDATLFSERKMRIFKFGGASVKDASSVKNVANVLKKVGHEDVLIIVSAMGKTTNALEAVVETYLNNPGQLKTALQELEAFHLNIVADLLGENKTPLVEKVRGLIQELATFFKHNKAPNYSFCLRSNSKFWRVVIDDYYCGLFSLYRSTSKMVRRTSMC